MVEGEVRGGAGRVGSQNKDTLMPRCIFTSPLDTPLPFDTKPLFLCQQANIPTKKLKNSDNP
jgi:hypothetical protein